MNSNTRTEINSLARTLHDLFRALPAIQQHKGPDAVQKQLELIAYVQKQYDRLALRA